MINNLLYHYFLEDGLISMQVYLFFLFLFFGIFSYDFIGNNKHSITFNYLNTIFGLSFTFDFTIFFILNYEVIIFAIFYYFYDPIYHIFSLKDPELISNSITFLKGLGLGGIDINILFIYVFYMCSILLFLATLYYMVFAYLNIILIFFKKKSFNDLTNHRNWYDWDNFLTDFQKEFGEKK